MSVVSNDHNAAAIGRLFLNFSSRRLQDLSRRVDTCLAQLSDAQVWIRGGQNENAVGNLVLHLCGNVRQWIIASVGGEDGTRRRDVEFSTDGGITSRQLRDRLSETVTRARTVIDGVSAQRLSDRLVIQKYGVSVLDAIYHVVEHFSMHTGQIIFVTKTLTGKGLGFDHDLESIADAGTRHFRVNRAHRPRMMLFPGARSRRRENASPP